MLPRWLVGLQSLEGNDGERGQTARGLEALAALGDEGCPWPYVWGWRGREAGCGRGRRGFGAFPACSWQRERSRCVAKYGAGSCGEARSVTAELFWVAVPALLRNVSCAAAVCLFG